MTLRGIRGAAVARSDNPKDVLSAAKELLLAVKEANPTLETVDIASVIFTVTHDLVTAYPAEAARQIGWVDVPLMCAQEIPVPNGLPRCIRILLHWNTGLPQDEIRHVYLGDAARLRPDLLPHKPAQIGRLTDNQIAPEEGGES